MKEKVPLHIASSPKLLDTYRSLLTSDWPEGHPAAVNQLIRDLLKGSRVLVSFPWEDRAVRAPRSASRRIAAPPNAAPYVQELIERLHVNLPRVPGRIPDRQDPIRSRLSRETLKATFFLSLQSRFRLDGDVGFLADCQSLLFSSVVHVLWPSLQGKGMGDEQHLLLSYLWMHTIVAWEQQPSHKYFLQSQLFGLLGDASGASGALLYAFRTCNPSDHDWITKAQAYWASLIESDRIEDARRFAVLLYRSAGAEHLEEIMELIDDSYSYERARPRPRPRKTG